MSLMTRPRVPEGLDEAGRALWRATVAAYVLSPTELAMLSRACRSVDALAAVDAEIDGQGLSVRGSRGQVIPNRMLKLRCEMERVLDVQLRSLALPMPDENTGHRRSPAAVAAAQARWRAQGG
jgi:hypothetical protein